ncbi:hypothetical protein YN1551_3256 [Sulfolobus islandicus Y.N.15.51]|uniref:Uncharacterized protein n=1 Tax=Saccharolobus islandicus (strain Y.N.15.51 / Yellowstone \|nr:hypothetical protein YN1551_3256 [Sulfolobus islandicus Y.N.15.51]
MVKIRIKDVKVKSIAVPIRGKLLRVAGEHPGRNVFTLVEIITDKGVTGYSETGGGGFSLAPLIEKLKDQLIGEDAFNIRKLKWKTASPITATYYNQLLTVCPYTFISIILYSFMIECRDLALNHLPNLTVDGSWDSFDPNGTGLTSPTLFIRLYSETTSLCHLSFSFSQTPTLGALPPSG